MSFMMSEIQLSHNCIWRPDCTKCQNEIIDILTVEKFFKRGIHRIQCIIPMLPCLYVCILYNFNFADLSLCCSLLLSLPFSLNIRLGSG